MPKRNTGDQFSWRIQLNRTTFCFLFRGNLIFILDWIWFNASLIQMNSIQRTSGQPSCQYSSGNSNMIRQKSLTKFGLTRRTKITRPSIPVVTTFQALPALFCCDISAFCYYEMWRISSNYHLRYVTDRSTATRVQLLQLLVRQTRVFSLLTATSPR